MNTKRNSSSFFRGTACALLLSCGFSLALADELTLSNGDSVSETTWNCWNERNVKILCSLVDTSIVSNEDFLPAPSIDPNASAYPSREPLPDLVETILERPEYLRDRTISIPLYSPPETHANAEALADAVMCGARPGCHVEFFHSIWMVALLYETDPARD